MYASRWWCTKLHKYLAPVEAEWKQCVATAAAAAAAVEAAAGAGLV
jgi:hypothetical protein